MLKVKVNATENILLPERPEEVKLKGMIDFELKYQELLKWIAEIGPARMMFKTNQILYITKLAENISVLSGIKKEDLFGIKVGDLHTHLKYLNKKGNFDLKGTKDSIVKLHLLMIKVIIKYVPQIFYDEYEFEYKGKKWYLPHLSKGFYSGQVLNPAVTFGNAVEALENDRVQEEKIKKKGYGDGSIEYTRIIKSVAIFAYSKKDKPVKSRQQLSKRINERMHYFKDVNMKIGLDCSFFLSNFS